MKIYFRNRTAKLTNNVEWYSCVRCPFYDEVCPIFSSTILDCDNRGWWTDGESSEIFKL